MRDKQIEEMANYCCYPCDRYDEGNEGKDCTYCDYKICLCAEAAKALYNAGYRKASDVALETVDSFQRILRHIFLNMCDGNDYERLNLLQIDRAIEALYDSFIAELKKKYESEGEG